MTMPIFRLPGPHGKHGQQGAKRHTHNGKHRSPSGLTPSQNGERGLQLVQHFQVTRAASEQAS